MWMLASMLGDQRWALVVRRAADAATGAGVRGRLRWPRSPAFAGLPSCPPTAWHMDKSAVIIIIIILQATYTSNQEQPIKNK